VCALACTHAYTSNMRAAGRRVHRKERVAVDISRTNGVTRVQGGLSCGVRGKHRVARNMRKYVKAIP